MTKTNDAVSKLMELGSDKSATEAYPFLAEEEIYDFDPKLLEFDPVAGAPILGKLDKIEQKLYRIMVGIESAQEDLEVELGKAINANIAHTILNGDGSMTAKALDQIVKQGMGDRVEEHFRLELLLQKVNGTFWFRVRTRLQSFATILQIRSGYTVCKIGNKYDA